MLLNSIAKSIFQSTQLLLKGRDHFFSFTCNPRVRQVLPHHIKLGQLKRPKEKLQVRILTFAALIALLNFAARADEKVRHPLLDPAYPHLEHPRDDSVSSTSESLTGDSLALSKSNLSFAISLQTPVRNQEERGTCSIFSAIAWVESYLIRNELASRPNFSEEWLEYLISRKVKDDGSNSVKNFSAIIDWGLVREKTLPYVGQDWTNKKNHSKRGPWTQRCGHLKNSDYWKSCLVGHFDPQAVTWSEEELRGSSAEALLRARNEAQDFWEHLRSAVELPIRKQYVVTTVSEIKALLRAGIPLTLDIDYYFGAWNDSWGKKYGISSDRSAYEQGIIGYPENGSVDRLKSVKEPAGHSVLVIGYDDTIEVTTNSVQSNGNTQTFQYRGVYFIKNSWGKAALGSKFKAQGISAPGYAMITQKYAHEFGAFYRMNLPEKNDFNKNQ